jgi:peroxiredoxin
MRTIITLSLLLLALVKGNTQDALPTVAEDISPLLVGETFPDEGTTDLNHKAISIHSLAAEKPSIVVFYRGGWCPYCNRHLAALGKAEQKILDLGYQIIAISPDAPTELKKTMDKNELSYQLLSDGKGTLAKAAGLAFQAPERYGERLSKYSDGANKGYLPVPAVFVLNKDAEILFEYISPNYKQRLSSEVLLAVLENLEGE